MKRIVLDQGLAPRAARNIACPRLGCARLQANAPSVILSGCKGSTQSNRPAPPAARLTWRSVDEHHHAPRIVRRHDVRQPLRKSCASRLHLRPPFTRSRTSITPSVPGPANFMPKNPRTRMLPCASGFTLASGAGTPCSLTTKREPKSKLQNEAKFWG
jgi:hypothetical protein